MVAFDFPVAIMGDGSVFESASSHGIAAWMHFRPKIMWVLEMLPYWRHLSFMVGRSGSVLQKRLLCSFSRFRQGSDLHSITIARI